MQWNPRGIKNKRIEAQILMDRCKAQVFCIGESKIPPHEDFIFAGYEVFLKNKELNPGNNAHGGVAILARKEVAPIPVKIKTNFQAVAISVKLHKRITIVSIYIPPGVSGDFTEGELEKLIDQLPKPYMILGDFNAHNTLWFGKKVNGRGTIIENVLMKKKSYFLDQDHDTYVDTRGGEMSSSHIDLSICSLDLLQDFEWGVYDDLMRSDHFPIWIRSGRKSRPQRYPKWIMEKADWHKFQEEAVPKMNINEFDSANEANRYVTDLLVDAAKQSIPKTSGLGRDYSAIWFNKECYEAKTKRQEAFYKWRMGLGSRGAWQKEVAVAHKVFRRVKRRSWRDFIEGINGNDKVGDLWRKIRLLRNTYTNKGVSTLRVRGRIIDDPGEIAEVIARTIEDVSSETSCSPEFLRYRQRAERKKIKFSSSRNEPYNVPITRAELDAALSGLKNDSSPGPDEIHNRMLKNLPEEAKEMLLQFLNKIFLEGEFPEEWRLAHVIPLLKDGKDPLDPESYRPISLTSCLCKLLEKILDVRLMWFLEQQQVIDLAQCGGLRGKGTVDCLVALENEIHEAFLKNRLLVALFLDLEKAYQTAWQYLVMRELYDAGLRGNLGKFISEFMRDRKFQVRVGNRVSLVHNLDLGVPQGSVLSVKLFLIAVNTVIKFIPNTISRAIYVDDFRLSIAVQELESAKRVFDGVCKDLVVWMKVTGFRISLTKTKIVVFHRRPEGEKAKFPVLDFAFEIGLNGAIFEVVRDIRVLGVIFDQRLTWLLQAGSVRRGGFQALNAMKAMAKGNGRTTRETYLKIYKAVVLPKIDYGSEVYGTAKQWILKKLDPIHHAALRLCLGAFRSSRKESLYVESYIPSLWDRRDYLNLCYMYRAQRISEDRRLSGWEDNSLDERYERLKGKPKSFGFLTRRVRDELQLDEPNIKAFRTYDIPPWWLPCLDICFHLEYITKKAMNDVTIGQLFREHKHDADIEIYTDGSKRCNFGSRTKGKVGAGVYIKGCRINKQLKERLGDFASVFTAELVAIRIALIELREIRNHSCVLYSDSRSALQALQVYNSNNGLVQDIKELVYELKQNRMKITFCWVPSHVSTIGGNNIADELAKGAGDLPGRDGPLVFFTDWKAHIKEKILHRWKEEWTYMVDDKWTQLRGVQDFIEPRKWGSGLSRLEDIKITRLRIGHTRFARDYYYTGEGPPECEECGEQLTVQHLLLECVAYNHQRRVVFQDMGELTLPNLLGISSGQPEKTDQKFKIILTFFKSIGYFEKI